MLVDLTRRLCGRENRKVVGEAEPDVGPLFCAVRICGRGRQHYSCHHRFLGHASASSSVRAPP
jgi:hypothetical protein